LRQDPRIIDLFRAADVALQAGRASDAVQLWNQVLQLDPRSGRALMHLGQHRLQLGDPAGARRLLEDAASAEPNDPVIALNLSAVARAQGDAAGEFAALERALAVDPYFLPALLGKAVFFDRAGRSRQAASVYKDVLTIAPRNPDAWMVKPLERAREAVAQNVAALDTFLERRLGDARRRSGGGSTSFNEAKDILTGAKTAKVQQPTMLHFPRLPAIPFYEREDFPWLAEVEAATDVIRAEFLGLLRDDARQFGAYVKHPPGVPLNQWAELNHSPKWSAFFLWQDGKRLDDHCARCPNTAAVLEAAPMVHVPHSAPAAFFSTLEPKTLIPPHTGVTNTRLIVHVPLIVPEGCWFRVGNERREWKPGEALIFDDTIEHEAWNGSDQMRAILIFDIWNPYLSEGDRELVCELLEGYREFYGRP
jgi:aspartyl/asparaginyl beta-hydroxylase (cupin superfamily)